MSIQLRVALIAFFLTSVVWAENDPFGVMEPLNFRQCSIIDPTQPIDLGSAVAQALCANPQTYTAWAEVRYQSALLGSTKSSYLPTIGANTNLSVNRNKTAQTPYQQYSQESGSLTFNYLLYDFGNRDAIQDQAMMALLSSKNSYNNTLQSVFFIVVQSYYSLFQAQASLDAYISAEHSAKESLDAAEAKVKAGVAIQAEMLQARAAFAQAVLTRVGAEGTLSIAKGSFAASLGLDAQIPLVVIAPSSSQEHPIPETALVKLIEKAKQNRPDLAAARTDIKTAEAAIRVAHSSNSPTLSLISSVNGTDTSINLPATNANVGIALSFPIFTGYATTYKIAAAEEQRSLKQSMADALERQVALDVYTTYTNLITAGRQEKLTDDLVSSARTSYEVALGRYKTGVGTILDVTSSQSILSSAEQQKINSLYALALTRIALAKALGDNELMKNELIKEENR